MKVLDWEGYVAGSLAGKPFAATIGVFDGLHLGHRALVGRIVGRPGLVSAVLTFKENPKRILSPRTHQGEVSSLDQKLDLLESLSVDFCVLIDFSGDFSKLPGRRFLSILGDSGELRFLAVGEDFRCGSGLDTGAQDIRGFCGERSVGVELVPALRWAGHPVSSSRIRKAVTDGRLEDAEAMLGRLFEIDLRGASSADGRRWAPRGAQARPPLGTYEARLAFREGPLERPVSARLDAEGNWTLSEAAGSVLGAEAEAEAPVGLRLIRLVSRE